MRWRQAIRMDFGVGIWLALAIPLFWWAPRAPEAPAVTALESEVLARLDEIAKRDATAWQELHGDRRIPWVEANGHLAIVIDDVGRELLYTNRLLALPFPLTFSIVPGGVYADGMQARAMQDRRRYRELMLHLPMEPSTADVMHAGVERREDFLLLEDSAEQLRSKTKEAFARVPGAMGFNNHMGSGLTTDEQAMEVVMSAAIEVGAHFFLDSRTTAATRAEEVARRRGLLTGARDIFLDHDPTPAAVQSTLREAFARAKLTPTVLIAHPSAAVVSALQAGLPEAFSQGVGVYPLSELLAREAENSAARAGGSSKTSGLSPGALERR